MASQQKRVCTKMTMRLVHHYLTKDGCRGLNVIVIKATNSEAVSERVYLVNFGVQLGSEHNERNV